MDWISGVIVNVPGQWEGSEKVKLVQAAFLEDQIHYIKLGPIGRVINEIKMGPKPMRKTLRGVCLHAVLDWLAATVTDVWMDLLVQKKVDDHCV